MCHETCSTCTDGLYTSCTACIPTRFLFKGMCLCPDETFGNQDFSCSNQSASVIGVWHFLYAVEVLVLVFAMFAFINKVSAPLSRKLIDLSQAIGLLLYIDTYLDNKTTSYFKLFQMANLTYFFPNLFANHFYASDIDSTHTTNQYLDMSTQVISIWVLGFVMLFLVAIYQSCVKNTTAFNQFYVSNYKNFIHIMFYITFQESFLNMLLQIINLEFSEIVHVVGFIMMIVYALVCWYVIRNIIISLNQYPETQPDRSNEIRRRRLEHPFIYLFEGPVNIKSESFESAILEMYQNNTTTIYDRPVVVVNGTKARTSTSSNWILFQLLLKVALDCFAVLQYSNSSQTSLLVVAIVFVTLFVVISPVKSTLLWVLMLIADAYFILTIALVPNYETDFTHLFWPGIALVSVGVLAEVLWAHLIYAPRDTIAEQQRLAVKVHPGELTAGAEGSHLNAIDQTQLRMMINQINSSQNDYEQHQIKAATALALAARPPRDRTMSLNKNYHPYDDRSILTGIIQQQQNQLQLHQRRKSPLSMNQTNNFYEDMTVAVEDDLRSNASKSRAMTGPKRRKSQLNHRQISVTSPAVRRINTQGNYSHNNEEIIPKKLQYEDQEIYIVDQGVQLQQQQQEQQQQQQQQLEEDSEQEEFTQPQQQQQQIPSKQVIEQMGQSIRSKDQQERRSQVNALMMQSASQQQNQRIRSSLDMTSEEFELTNNATNRKVTQSSNIFANIDKISSLANKNPNPNRFARSSIEARDSISEQDQHTINKNLDELWKFRQQ